MHPYDLNDIRRVNEHQPHAAHHPLQHVYLFFAYGLLSFKSCFADDFMAYASGTIGWVKVGRCSFRAPRLRAPRLTPGRPQVDPTWFQLLKLQI